MSQHSLVLKYWQMVQFNDDAINKRIADLRIREESNVTASRASQYGYNHINLIGYTINPEAVAAIPEDLARRASIIGFELRNNTLSIAAINPTDPNTTKAVATVEQSGYTTELYLTSQSSFEHAFTRYKDITNTTAKRKGILEISAEDVLALTNSINSVSDITAKLGDLSTSNNHYKISATIELLFAGALALGASDLHIEPEESAIRIRYRLDGVLRDIVDIDSYMYGRMMSRLKLLSGMTLNQKAEAQDGRFTFETTEKEIEVRSSVIPGAYGESIVMRLLDPTIASFQMERLNLNQHLTAVVERELKKPDGLIVTTGPTGSGKTTALYAFLQQVHTPETKIITIENPVEYKIDGIVQTQVEGEYTFAAGLRAILRQDPDVILVGEIRDKEVAETAIHASQTGHLVFSTLHTNSAVAGFSRLMDLDIDPRVFGSSINMLLGQRLVRTLCSECKQSRPITASERELLTYNLTSHPFPNDVSVPEEIYEAVGCDACGGSGYKGRTGIYEAVLMDDAVEEAVLRDPREHVIIEAAKPQQIPTMIHDGIDKISRGLTTIEEVERVIEIPRSGAAAATTPANTSVSDDDFLAHVV